MEERLDNTRDKEEWQEMIKRESYGVLTQKLMDNLLTATD